MSLSGRINSRRMRRQIGQELVINEKSPKTAQNYDREGYVLRVEKKKRGLILKRPN